MPTPVTVTVSLPDDPLTLPDRYLAEAVREAHLAAANAALAEAAESLLAGEGPAGAGPDDEDTVELDLAPYLFPRPEE